MAEACKDMEIDSFKSVCNSDIAEPAVMKKMGKKVRTNAQEVEKLLMKTQERRLELHLGRCTCQFDSSFDNTVRVSADLQGQILTLERSILRPHNVIGRINPRVLII